MLVGAGEAALTLWPNVRLALEKKGTNVFHIIGSISGSASLQAGLGVKKDQVLTNPDPLCCGPIPSTESPDRFRQEREPFLIDCYGEEFVLGDGGPNGFMASLDDLTQSDDPIFLWTACGLQDQIFTAQVFFFLKHLSVDRNRLCLVEAQKQSWTDPYGATGVIFESQFADLIRGARPVSDEVVDQYTASWRAYTASSPQDILAVFERHSTSLFTRGVQAGLIGRYPERNSGLNAIDRRLLSIIGEADINADKVVGQTMTHTRESGDFASDLSIYDRLLALADKELAHPLVELRTQDYSMRSTEVWLSPFGKAVLAGEENHMHANGLDDWIGGVHLKGSEPCASRVDGQIVLR